MPPQIGANLRHDPRSKGVRMLRRASIMPGLALIAGLISPGTTHGAQTRAPAAAATPVRVETVVRGLEHPWGLQFLPGVRLLVTERPGRIRIVERSGALSAPLAGVPTVAAVGQGGLLDIALAPDFATSGLVYLAYAEPRGGNRNGTSVARARLVAAGGAPRLEGAEVIFRQQPEGTGGLHFGARLAFAPDGRLFVALGERYQKDFAQDLGRHWGKVVRINADGSVPADNPFVGRSGVLPEIWSYGHRNPQSAAIHPATGRLWVVEHGPRGGDEVNIPLAGRNYGWPVIGYGIDYSGARIHESTQKEGMEQPVYYWRPSIAPSGMAFYTGDLFPGWRGSLLVGALAGRALHRLVLDGETVAGEEVLLADQGHRIRDVRIGPDAAVWLLTDAADGRILRLAPGG
jgi:glucose/arabinose dehydrogenase